MSNERFSVRKVELSTESEGPDYFTVGEFQVVETATGRIVARFTWSLEEAYLTNASYAGPDDVRISEDGREAIAREGREERRVLLPPWLQPIDFGGIEIAPDADFTALVRSAPDGQWLWKLYERLGCTPQAEALALAIGAMAASPDSRERATALKFYYFVPDAPGFEQILAALNAESSLPAGLLSILAKHKPAWLKSHALEIARANDDRWQEILDALYGVDDEDFELVAVNFVRANIVSREELLHYATGKYPDHGCRQIERAFGNL